MRAFILSLALAFTVGLTGCEAEDADTVEAEVEAGYDAAVDEIEAVDPTPFEGDTAVVVDDDVMDEPLVDTDPDTTGM